MQHYPAYWNGDEWWGLPIPFPGGGGWPSLSLVKFSSRWYNHSVIIHTLYTNVMLSRGCYFLMLDLFLCFNFIFQSALQYNFCNIVTVEVCTQLLKLAIYLCVVVLKILQKHAPEVWPGIKSNTFHLLISTFKLLNSFI